MPPLISLLGSLTVLVCGALCALPIQRDYGSPQDVRYYRDESDQIEKPVRDDSGLGSLLLKNLRFRDLGRRHTQLESSFPLWAVRHQNGAVNDFLPTDIEHSQNSIGRGVSKRQSNLDVAQLAQILNDLKARSTDDDGVKLQSLRFGRRRR